MALAFSTLGCPEASLEQVIQIAANSGATGVELRFADGQIVYPGMSVEDASSVAQALNEAGIKVLTLASYVRVCEADPEENPDAVAAALEEALRIASALKAPYVRVFPGAGLPPALDGNITDAMALADQLGADRLNAAASLAQSLGVTILLETHDSHPRGTDVRRIIDKLDRGVNVRVIWDLMHPFRHDEDPAETAKLISDSFEYAQYKDGVRVPGGNTVELTLPGQGQLPLKHMQELVNELSARRGIDDPWVSLEWELAWHPELPPLPLALESLKQTLS